MYKKILFVLAVLVIIVFVSFMFFNQKSQPESRPRVLTENYKPSATVIKVTVDGFSPKEVSIKVGDTVDFINGADSSCNSMSIDCTFWPASNPHPTHEIYPEFDPRSPIAPGEVWTFVFDKAGDWGFHDHFHFTNRGIIHVGK